MGTNIKGEHNPVSPAETLSRSVTSAALRTLIIFMARVMYNSNLSIAVSVNWVIDSYLFSIFFIEFIDS